MQKFNQSIAFAPKKQVPLNQEYKWFKVLTDFNDDGYIQSPTNGDVVKCREVSCDGIYSDRYYVMVCNNGTVVSKFTDTVQGFFSIPGNDRYERDCILRENIVKCYVIDEILRYEPEVEGDYKEFLEKYNRCSVLDT